ncbi:MAG: LacI family DNA-binding transcriptional regulator [Tissierellales bacterium]|nr:LacI family DNA-binding transcriptional regulator [Tissierellales bacterium]MBN2827865.1 LacI family DNA-binding transcriptional regulator [Tissierellales bacterium]
MVTIKDVARLSGVSISTVSRVINDSKPVSPEIRKNVLKVIEETGYRPNDVARSLVTKRSYLIGVIVNDLSNSYVAEMVKGVEEIGKMYNFDILLCSSYYDKDAQINYLSLLNRKQAEGIILIGYHFDPVIIETVNKYNKHAIYFTRDILDEKADYVRIDGYAASYEMTGYLIKKGHKKIAFMTDFDEKSVYETKKIAGYKQALEEKEISFSKIYTAGGRRYQHGYDAAVQIIPDLNEISAIFCTNDELAIGLINHLYDKGFKVPEDVSIVGYGGYKESQFVRPTLTTISEPYYDIGAVCIRTLIKKIEGDKSFNSKIELPFSFVKRNSVKELV